MAHYTDSKYTPTDAELEYLNSGIKPKDDQHRVMLNDCCTPRRSGKLSAWERDFISDLQDWLDDGYKLSKKQAARLELIWEKATAEG